MQKQKGFTVVEVLILIVVLALIGGATFFVFNKKSSKQTEVTSSNAEQVAKSNEVKIKNIGVNLGTYDPATNKAGDFLFKKDKFTAGIQMIFMNFGMVISGENTDTRQSKTNPQPTFILPLGTQVRALVDGEVYDVPKLYSGDYSVMVQGKGSDLIFETEHVKNVKVKKGDNVKAGDVVAEVSDYDAHNYAGLGLVEIGVLKGGDNDRPPSHLCPFDYLDDSIKEDTLKKITALQKAWEEYRGDTTIYDESKVVIPGCESRTPVEG